MVLVAVELVLYKEIPAFLALFKQGKMEESFYFGFLTFLNAHTFEISVVVGICFVILALNLLRHTCFPVSE
jgi:hypothetical protein